MPAALRYWAAISAHIETIHGGLADELDVDATWLDQAREAARVGMRTTIVAAHEAAVEGRVTQLQYDGLRALIDLFQPTVVVREKCFDTKDDGGKERVDRRDHAVMVAGTSADGHEKRTGAPKGPGPKVAARGCARARS